MSKVFKGRAILPGNTTGEAVVSRQGMNILASYQKSALKKTKQMICGDQNNPDLYKKDLRDKIICLPQTIGSTTGGMILETAIQMGIGPRAMLFADHIDSLAAAGLILSDVWLKNRVITIDQLGADFLRQVQDGQTIEIKEDGTVIILS
ncbi:MAG TPA: DUF126 domain-containing protein [Capillibacterium sp.]